MRIEKIFAGIVLISLILKFLIWPFGSEILILIMPIISLFYITGFIFIFNEKETSKQKILLSIIAGLFWSIIPIGILFKILFWPYGQEMLKISSISAVIIFFIIYYLKSYHKEEYSKHYSSMFKRALILAVISVCFYILPNRTIINIEYRDDKELARLKLLHYSNPNNKQYKQQHDNYEKLRDSISSINN